MGIHIVGVLHGVESRQIAYFPRKPLSAGAVPVSLQFVLLSFRKVFRVCHRFQLSFGYLGAKQCRPGKKRATLVPEHKVAVPRWSQFRRANQELRKAFDRRAAGAALGDKERFGCTLFGIALDNNRSQPNGRPGRIRVPARHSDKTTLHVPPFGLDLKDVTVGLLPGAETSRWFGCKQGRR
jgi:hypothetical protein